MAKWLFYLPHPKTLSASYRGDPQTQAPTWHFHKARQRSPWQTGRRGSYQDMLASGFRETQSRRIQPKCH